jgi:hypothetical protein
MALSGHPLLRCMSTLGGIAIALRNVCDQSSEHKHFLKRRSEFDVSVTLRRDGENCFTPKSAASVFGSQVPGCLDPVRAHISGMKRIVVECLSCGHCSSIAEERLKAFGLSPDAPIAKFIRRLICTECGSHSVRAYRDDLQDAG